MLYCFVGIGYSEELPYLKSILVEVNVTYEEASERFHYKYKIFNQQESLGAVADVYLDVSMPDDSIVLPSDGLMISGGKNWNGESLFISFDNELASRGETINPKPLPFAISHPDNWGGGITGNMVCEEP